MTNNNGDIDVFSTAGKYLGRVNPSNISNGNDGCIGLIATIIAMALLAVVMLLAQLVVAGFLAAKQKNWGVALLYWAIPILLLLSIVGSYFTSTAWGEKVLGTQVEVVNIAVDDNSHVRYEVHNGTEYPILYPFETIWIEPGQTAWILTEQYVRYLGNPPKYCIYFQVYPSRGTYTGQALSFYTCKK